MIIEMRAHEYRRLDQKSGKMVREFSPRFCRTLMLIALAMMAWAFFNRAQIDPDIYMLLMLFLSFNAGGMFTAWLRRNY